MKSGQSGVAIAVKCQTFNSVLDVTSTSHNNIVVTRVGLDSQALRLIVGYAPQENAGSELREEFFTELEIEASECKMAGELPLLIGDMNAKIAVDSSNCVKGITSNGKLLMDVMEGQELSCLNFDHRCTGKWTHVVRTTGASSVLDYLITSTELSKYLKEVIIDEECLHCPFGVKKKTPKYSDHNAIIATFQIPYTKKKQHKQQGWRITEEGLTNFHTITSSEEFPSTIAGNSNKSKYCSFEKIISGTMDECFRKTKPHKERPTSKPHFELYKKVMKYAKKGKAQRAVARTYIVAMKNANHKTVAARNKESLKTTLHNLTIDNSFSPNNFWELCKKNRSKNNTMGTSVITESGNEVYGEDIIKDTYKREFNHRLRERQIVPELKNYEERTKLLCQLYTESAKENKTPEYTASELDIVVKKLKKNKSSGRDKLPPEIFICWGEKLKHLTLHIMNAVKDSHVIPKQWFDVLISTIYKNKGNKKMLVNQRGIFLKQILSKMFERINLNRIEENVRKIDMSQAGSRSNRGPADQTFLLRGCIDHAKYMNRPLYIVLYDYSQCFDSLWLEDCLLSLWNLGVNNDILSLIQDLNKQCNIVVKTPVGLADQFTVENIVQQGSVSGGILCSASTGEAQTEITDGGTQIGTSHIKVLVYVDDIATINTLLKDVYGSHERIIWFSKKKRLTVNGKKCIVLCVNLKHHDIVPRLVIDGIPVPVKDSAAYLGDQFNSRGTNKDLIEERVKKGKGCVISSMALCSDTTMGLHAIETLMLLYKSLFIPITLYNAQAWSNVTKAELKSLRTVQLKFLKRTFHAPSSTSNPLTFLETGTLPIEHEIHTKQLNFLHHILTLNNNDPVKLTYNQQLQYSAPNWANEVRQLRSSYGIPHTDTEIARMTKPEWKTVVRGIVRHSALLDLNAEASKQKSGQKLPAYSCLSAQDYIKNLTPAQARKIFHIRTGTVDLRGIRNYLYGDDNTSCRLCNNADEDVEHIVNNCSAIQRIDGAVDIYTTNSDILRVVANRCLDFDRMVGEMEN